MKGPSNNADLSDHVVAVVDDDSSARTALSRLLKSEGIETVTFASARDFLDTLVALKALDRRDGVYSNSPEADRFLATTHSGSGSSSAR